MIIVQNKFDKIGPVIAGVLMITVLFIASFFLTGLGLYMLLFFLIGLTEFLSRMFFKSGILAMILPFAAFRARIHLHRIRILIKLSSSNE